MKVFLSWSGERSKRVAEALHEWLPLVIQSVEPWMSAADIDSGARWAPAITQQLEESKFGIVCLTSDNLGASWLLFEAGALAKTKDASVCTFLLDLNPGDVKWPLAQFQARTREKNDVRKLVETIALRSREIGDRAPRADSIETVFNTWWPRLDDLLKVAANLPGGVPADRGVTEVLEEVLETVRRLERERREEIRAEVEREAEIRRKALRAATIKELQGGGVIVTPTPGRGKSHTLQALVDLLEKETTEAKDEPEEK